MGKTIAVTSWNYSASSRYLKIFMKMARDLFHPVPQFIYENLYVVVIKPRL